MGKDQSAILSGALRLCGFRESGSGLFMHEPVSIYHVTDRLSVVVGGNRPGYVEGRLKTMQRFLGCVLLPASSAQEVSCVDVKAVVHERQVAEGPCHAPLRLHTALDGCWVTARPMFKVVQGRPVR